MGIKPQQRSFVTLWPEQQKGDNERSVRSSTPIGWSPPSPKPLMSWTWNAGREEGKRGFGEGDASHLFPWPKVRKINPDALLR